MVKGGNVAAIVADKAYELGRAMAATGLKSLLGQETPPFIVAPALTVTKARSSLSKPSIAPGRVVVKKTRAVLTVKVGATGVGPTGRVTITGGGLPKQTVTVRGGKAVVKLPAFRTAGLKTLTVTYAGDRFVSGDTTRVRVRVLKR